MPCGSATMSFAATQIGVTSKIRENWFENLWGGEGQREWARPGVVAMLGFICLEGSLATAGRRALGMTKGFQVALAEVRTSRLVVAVVLLVLGGRTSNANAQTVTNLHSFGSFPSDGKNPYAGLVQGSDGNFYGTAESGGTNNNGSVFRISPGGSYTNFHIFVGFVYRHGGSRALSRTALPQRSLLRRRRFT